MPTTSMPSANSRGVPAPRAERRSGRRSGVVRPLFPGIVAVRRRQRWRRPCAELIAHGHTTRGRRRAVAAHHRLRRRQGPGDAQVRRHRTPTSCRTWPTTSAMAARLPARRHRTGRRPPRLAGAGEGRPAGAGLRHPAGYRITCCNQMVTVMRGGEEVKLSKRAGSYLTLRDLIDEAGPRRRPAGSWSRKADSQLTFDIDLARSQSNDNPVYYVRYAHASAACCARPARRATRTTRPRRCCAAPLDDAPARDLMRELSRYPEVSKAAARTLEPHLVAQYLRELANAFHGWYHASPVLVEDADLRDARLALALATAGAGERPRPAGRGRTGEHVMAARRGKSQARRNGSTACRAGLAGDRRAGDAGRGAGAPRLLKSGRHRRLLPSEAESDAQPASAGGAEGEAIAPDTAPGAKPATPARPSPPVRFLHPCCPAKKSE